MLAGDAVRMDEEDPALGLPRGSVRVVAADPGWPEAFRAESERLEARIARAGLPPLVFEHVGSTAVPSLAAKPIIDLMAGYETGVDPRLYSDPFCGAGYEHRGPQRVPERKLFVLGPESARTHHLNLVQFGGRFWREHLAFRDRLRNEPDVKAAYAALKVRLAACHSTDRGAYTSGKAAFVQHVTSGGRLPPTS